jgi:hypothetical protein
LANDPIDSGERVSCEPPFSRARASLCVVGFGNFNVRLSSANASGPLLPAMCVRRRSAFRIGELSAAEAKDEFHPLEHFVLFFEIASLVMLAVLSSAVHRLRLGSDGERQMPGTRSIMTPHGRKR